MKGWGKPERIRNASTWSFEIRSSQGVLELTVGHRTARWNGLQLDLGYAPRLSNGQPLLHILDLSKTLEPLTLRPALLDANKRVIVIDPGHGGDNRGAQSVFSGQFEKEFTLDWALRVERLLRTQGWTVHLTRTNDVDLSLGERVAFADRVKGDLFLSLHFNSIESARGRNHEGGLETYCLTPAGMPSTLTREFEDDASTSFPNNAFDAENYYFAARLQRALVDTLRRKDRGVRRARFMGILRGQNRPAVLLEAGYLTQPDEAELISSPEYRQKLAEAVAKALLE